MLHYVTLCYTIKKLKMKVNLLQKRHDFITEKFISGFISLDDFLMLEDIFIKNEKLYTIYLN